MVNINEWLNLIHMKKILNVKIDNKLAIKYNKLTNLNYIISFDIEFIRYAINNRQVQTIHELGGLILEKKNNNWYLICLFHFNLIPLINNIKQYYLLTSNYNTLTDTTTNKVIAIENELLPENLILTKNDLKLLNTNRIINRYLSKNKIEELKKQPFEIIKKKISKIEFMIKGSDLNEKDYELFKNSINLILNDPDVLSREINKKNEKKFIQLTNELFANSFLIVKGLEDIKALKNHSLMLNEKSLKLVNYFDIAKYNNILFKKCDSAELEKTYLCLDKLKLTKPYELYHNIINDFTKLKPHNPLVDAYYTWILFNILD